MLGKYHFIFVANSLTALFLSQVGPKAIRLEKNSDTQQAIAWAQHFWLAVLHKQLARVALHCPAAVVAMNMKVLCVLFKNNVCNA